jgi:outer membrane protein assembly factor BamB
MRPTRIRWWPALVIALFTLFALVWIWTTEASSWQDKNMKTGGVLLLALALLFLWAVLFSRISWRTRGAVFLGVPILAGGFFLLFEVRGVTGDFIPVFEWRWGKNASLIEERPAISEAAVLPVSSRADYPQFLGPDRNAIVAGPPLSRDWNSNPPVELWRRPVGAGWSAFAISGEYAVTMEQRGAEERVSAYHLPTGELLWTHSDSARFFDRVAGEGPRATPAIAGGQVFALGATGILNCLDLAKGELFWSKNILEENAAPQPEWGVSGSPLVAGNKVIVSAGGRAGQSLVAYHLDTGERIWAAGDDAPGYSSPYLADLGGVPQVLIFNAGAMTAHALDSGDILWQYPWRRGHPRVAMPVVFPEDRVLISSGYGTGSELIAVASNGAWETERLWRSIRLKAKFTNVVHRDGYIYGLDDGIMVCLRVEDGALQWKEGRYGHGQVILVNDLLLVMAEFGDVILLEPAPEESRELGRFTAFQRKTWNPPALAGNLLLIRNDQEAACYRLP